MIHTRRTVTVGNNSSTIDNPIVLYRGDREVEVEFVIMGNKFTFSNGGNVIKSTHATLGQLVINTPTGLHMFSEVTECQEGSVIFTISKEMIDELIEVGFYSFQIRLFDATQLSRVTIPPVFEGIDIRTPIAAEDENNMVDSASVGYAVIQNHVLDDDILDTFNFDGQYNITRWMNGDRITSGKLNKIEDALLNINNTALIDHADMKKAIENNYALLESNKANKSDVVNIKNQLDNLVIESGGDSNPEVVQARNGFPTLNERISYNEAMAITNISTNLIGTNAYLGTSTNSATAVDDGLGEYTVTCNASWGGTFSVRIRASYGQKLLFMCKLIAPDETMAGVNCWITAYQYSSVGMNLGGASTSAKPGFNSNNNTNTSNYVMIHYPITVSAANTGYIDIGISSAQYHVFKCKEFVVLDVTGMSDEELVGLNFPQYDYWEGDLGNFVSSKFALNSEYSNNAAFAEEADYAAIADTALYTENGPFLPLVDEYTNLLGANQSTNMWDNGVSYEVNGDEILVTPTVSWGGEMLQRWWPNKGATNVNLYNKVFMYACYVKAVDRPTSVSARAFAYMGNFAKQLGSYGGVTTGLDSSDFKLITFTFSVAQSETNVLGVGITNREVEPYPSFIMKHPMLIDVTGFTNVEIENVKAMISANEYWDTNPPIGTEVKLAHEALRLSEDGVADIVADVLSTIGTSPFTDVTSKLAWTTATKQEGTSFGWWIENKATNLEVGGTYMYIVKWEGEQTNSFQRCDELRNGAWVNNTTITNQHVTKDNNLKIMVWIFTVADAAPSPTLCLVVNNPILTTDVDMTVELHKINDESYANAEFAGQLARKYRDGNVLSDFDFDSKIKWEDASSSIPTNKWAGKNVLVIGDSITAAGQWQLRLAYELGMNVTTHAKGGVGTIAMVDGDKGLGGDYDNTTNASGTLYPLDSDDVLNKDLIVVLPAYNDRGKDEGKVGDLYPTNNTIAGMIQYLINRIYEELTKVGNLNCKILIATPHCAGAYNYNYIDGYGEYPAGTGRTMETLSNTIKAVANYNNIPVCDLWHNSGINRFTWSIYGANANAENNTYARYQLNAQGEVVGTSPMRYTTGGQYYQWRDGAVVLETYTGSAPYPFVGDQLHCSSAGYARIGECIIGSIIRAYGY